MTFQLVQLEGVTAISVNAELGGGKPFDDVA